MFPHNILGCKDSMLIKTPPSFTKTQLYRYLKKIYSKKNFHYVFVICSCFDNYIVAT